MTFLAECFSGEKNKIKIMPQKLVPKMFDIGPSDLIFVHLTRGCEKLLFVRKMSNFLNFQELPVERGEHVQVDRVGVVAVGKLVLFLLLVFFLHPLRLGLFLGLDLKDAGPILDNLLLLLFLWRRLLLGLFLPFSSFRLAEQAIGNLRSCRL